MEITEIKTLDDALAVIRQLLEIVKKQGDEIAKLREENEKLRQENEKLRQENAWLKRQLFGSKAERYIPTDDTPSLFPEEESPAQPEKAHRLSYPGMSGKYATPMRCPKFPPICRVKNA